MMLAIESCRVRMIYLCTLNDLTTPGPLVLCIIVLVSLRRVLAIRNRRDSTIVRVPLAPLLNNSRQHSPKRVRRLDVNIRCRVRRCLEVLVQRASIAAVEIDGGVTASRRVPVTNMVAGLLANEVEDVGADVEAAESVEVPVGFDGADFGVVVVVV